MAKRKAKAKKRKLVKPVIKPKAPGDGYKTQRDATPDNQIRNWRIYRGFRTQIALAEACDMSRPRISNLESGIQPYQQHHLEALAKVLDCTPADLISVNPFELPDVLRIYTRLSAAAKRAVDSLIRSLHPSTHDPKPKA